MAELRFEGNHQEQAAQMKTAISELWAVLKGNGKPGLVSDVADISIAIAEMRAEQSAELRANKRWLRGIAALLTLFIAAVACYFSSVEARGKSELLIHPNGIHGSYSEPATASGHHQGAANEPSNTVAITKTPYLATE